MPTKSISDAVNLIETVIQSSDRHRSIPKPMLRPRHRLDSRVKVASRLSSTSSDKPRSSTAFILDGRFSEVLAIHFDGTLVLSRYAPTGISNSSQTLLTKFSLAFFRGPAVTESIPNPDRQKRPFVTWRPGRGRRRRRSARRRVASQFLAHRYAVSRRLGVPCEVHGCARTRAVCPSHNPDDV
jgi:hypothetical protein